MQETSHAFRAGHDEIGLAAQLMLPELGMVVRRSIQVKSHADNLGQIFIGRSGVTALSGFELSAGETVKIECDAASSFHIVADTAAQKYSWIAV